jgi:hypothetical protein
MGAWDHHEIIVCYIDTMLVPPLILLNEDDISDNRLGADLTISPTINLGLPEATVTWSRNNQVLGPGDPRVNISRDGVLIVTGVQPSDRGVYTVTAYNVAIPDGVTASIDVGINCKLTSF